MHCLSTALQGRALPNTSLKTMISFGPHRQSCKDLIESHRPRALLEIVWVGSFFVVPRMLNAMKILNKRSSENRKFENDLPFARFVAILGQIM